jgi:hypothetical protein
MHDLEKPFVTICANCGGPLVWDAISYMHPLSYYDPKTHYGLTWWCSVWEGKLRIDKKRTALSVIDELERLRRELRARGLGHVV